MVKRNYSQGYSENYYVLHSKSIMRLAPSLIITFTELENGYIIF
jgi:hypothetical protein